MKLLLIYPPFCTPTIPPYSISYLKSFVKNNSNIKVKCLDLNAKFHKLKFKKYYRQIKTDYENALTQFSEESKQVYSKNNKAVVDGKEPELLDEMTNMIRKEKPDIIAFSIVYNSQNFYTAALIKKLNDKKIIVGGPAVSEKIRKLAKFIQHEIALLEEFNITPKNFNTNPDFSDYKKTDYLSKDMIIPVKTSSSCYYKQCAFCTHHGHAPYFEFKMNRLQKSRYYFFIDEMIPLKRLLQIAVMMKKNKAKWWVQLRPTKELIPHMKELKKSGLTSISWGVESGSDKILKDMCKGTNRKDIEKVLQASKKAGIINIIYIIFGFPTEKEKEFLETIGFLKDNQKNIDLVSTSNFGLQKGSKVYNNPKLYGITKIMEQKRTVLEPKITFETKDGLNEKQLDTLRKRYAKDINKINKLPRVYNYLKEQTLFY